MDKVVYLCPRIVMEKIFVLCAPLQLATFSAPARKATRWARVFPNHFASRLIRVRK